MANVAWPSGLDRPTQHPLWSLENADRGGGAGLTGIEQVIVSMAARWRMLCEFMVRSDDEALSVWAFLAALDGRANTALVPAFSGRFANWPVDIYGRVLHPGFTRRKQLNATIYEDPAIPAASDITATANATAAIGATQIAINLAAGSPLKPGQLWGAGERLYRFTETVSVVGSVYTMKFRPRLREAIASAAPIKLTRPHCRMRLASPVQPDFDFYTAAPIALEFVEDY